MSSICFVGCAKNKRPVRTPAKDLYRSILFSRSRKLAEQAFDGWYILSAQHGVLTRRCYRPIRYYVEYDGHS